MIQSDLQGEDGLGTIIVANNLSLVLQDLREWEESVEYLQKALKAMQAKRGSRHPHTLSIRHNLAASLRALGHYDRAGEIDRQVLEIRTAVLGPDHSDTVKSMSCLAPRNYSAVGKHAEAAELFQRVYSARCEIYGQLSPPTLEAKENLMLEAIHLGKLEEASTLRDSLLDEMIEVDGPNASEIDRILIDYAHSVSDAGYQVEAALVMSEALAIREKNLGKGHPETVNARKDLRLILGRLSPDYAGILESFMWATEPRNIHTSVMAFFEADPVLLTVIRTLPQGCKGSFLGFFDGTGSVSLIDCAV